MSLRNQPYLPLYVQDYLTDEKLNLCSLATQGVYIKIMCIFHKSETYGGILLKQKDKQKENICLNFACKLAKLLPIDLADIESALNELLDEKVLIIEGDFLFQKRMIKDGKLSETRALTGKEGGKKTQEKYKNFAKAKNEANPEDENKYTNYNSINNNIQYVESIYRRLILGEKIKMSYEKFTSLITEFITTQELQEKKYFDEKDYKNHFFNWMKIKIKDAKNHDKLRQLA